MIRMFVAAALAISMAHSGLAVENAPVFEQVSDHCFYLRLQPGGKNLSVVITGQGSMLVNPPAEANLAVALKAISSLGADSSPRVLWVAMTDHHFSANAGTRHFAEQGAVLLASSRLRALAARELGVNFWNPATFMPELPFESFEEPQPYTWFVFGGQMRLFPEDLEIRICALEHKARTGGDVYVFIPEEKVLIVGDLFRAYHFPDIDTASDGSALGWIDGLQQVIDSVPLLKPAIKRETDEQKSETDSEDIEEEKTLEEQIIVLSSWGNPSNLQDMKDLLEISRRLERETSRAVRSGRSLERFLKSAGRAYRQYKNFESYATHLFEASSSKFSAKNNKKE